MSKKIYRWSGNSYHEYEVLRETPKTLVLFNKHSPYEMRIWKKQLDKADWQGSMFSFSRETIAKAAMSRLAYEQDRLRMLEKEVQAAIV